MSPHLKRVWTTAKIISDAILINVAYFISYWIRYELEWFLPVEEIYQLPFQMFVPSAVVYTFILLLVYWGEGVYKAKRGQSWLDEGYLVLRGTVVGTAIMIVLSVWYYTTLYSRLLFYVYAPVAIIVLLTLSRWVESRIKARLRKRGIGVERVLIVGAGETGRMIIRNLAAQPELGYELVGFVDDNPERGEVDLGRFKALGNTEKIPNIVSQYNVDEVIITLPWMYHRKILSIMAQCERQRVRVKIVPDLFQMSLSQVGIDDLNGIPLIGVRETIIEGPNLALKRAIDVIVSALALLILSPFMLLIALLIRLESPGSPIFKQVRLGKDGKAFTVYKFRSMRLGAEEEQQQLIEFNEATGPLFKIRQDPRRTRLGRLLRRLSIDEFPQFYNVLRGEMSLVGPRPPLPQEVEHYQEWQKRRLSVRPGLTGLWQVSGRSDLTFEEMVLLDLYYIENWSLALDLKIILKTIPTLIGGTGAY
ncbi:MAG: undecaprenyl-phosphate glucose phosphotransferase [Chloroflexi bacterium]|nr:undecaprenyl-phosphate glucose phosphotransferase [Chloroflexota bacterium]